LNKKFKNKYRRANISVVMQNIGTAYLLSFILPYIIVFKGDD